MKNRRVMHYSISLSLIMLLFLTYNSTVLAQQRQLPWLSLLLAKTSDYNPSLAIVPRAVILTELNQSVQLRLEGLDQLNPSYQIFWGTTNPQVVEVDFNGKITSKGYGSATIVATNHEDDFPPILVTVAEPADNTVLLYDRDILEGPATVFPNESYDIGSLLVVTLTGNVNVSPGDMLLSVEESIVAGRVANVVTLPSGSLLVTYETVALHESFKNLAIDESYRIENPAIEIPEITKEYFNVKKNSDGTIEFTQSKSINFTNNIADENLRKNAKASDNKEIFKAGPVSCEGDAANASIKISFDGIHFKLNPTLTVYKRYNGETLHYYYVAGDLNASATFQPKVQSSLSSELSCKVDVMYIYSSYFGPIGAALAQKLTVSLGASIKPNITIAEIGAEIKYASPFSYLFGVGCDGQGENCVWAQNLNAAGDASAEISIPELDNLSSQVKLELEYLGFLGLEWGTIEYANIGFKWMNLRGGIGDTYTIASPTNQLLDDSYKSEFKSAINVSLKPLDLAIAFKYFDIDPSIVTAETTFDLPGLRSPTLLQAKADKREYKTGQEIKFTVQLNPATAYWLGNYNVHEIQIYRKIGNNDSELVKRVTASEDQTTFSATWIATDSGPTEDNFFAFVLTNHLLVLNFPLELGPVEVPPGICLSEPQTVVKGNLEWQRCDDGVRRIRPAAIEFCENLVLGGYTDWELPTKTELKTLVHCSNGRSTPLNDFPTIPWSCNEESTDYDIPTIDPVFETEIDHEYETSSDSIFGNLPGKWVVRFSDGATRNDQGDQNNYVRCVRKVL